jgi:predicted pyridoxine 5'-phosphate oxidase superfamily flavin-nucleotide-binding protein
MARAFTQLAFSSAVKAAQVRYGAREVGERLEQKDHPRDRLNDDLLAFVGAVDNFFIGTASTGGWPTCRTAVDRRASSRCTLAFADYAGNRQYITVGNLSENDRVMLLIIDYERGRRLKIWGRATVIDDRAVFARVADPDYPAKVERIVRIDVQAWDLNCRQHFPKLIRERSSRRCRRP